MVSNLISVEASDGTVFLFSEYGGRKGAEDALDIYQQTLHKQKIDDKPS